MELLLAQLMARFREFLGREALAYQAKKGRGVWMLRIVEGKHTKEYVPRWRLTTTFAQATPEHYRILVKYMNEYDPTRQVVIVYFHHGGALQTIETLDIE